MARVDDYKQAFALSKEEISGKDPVLLARYSGAALREVEKDGISLSMNFLNREIVSLWPDMGFFEKSSKAQLSLQQQILLMHYLIGTWQAKGSETTGRWISFQEIPDGRFYVDAFVRRAKVPLVNAFGPDPERLKEVSRRVYGAEPLELGDVSVRVLALPLAPVALILWKGDDEFPPEGNLLFDQNVSKILSAEDIAWLAGMVVYPLTEAARAKS